MLMGERASLRWWWNLFFVFFLSSCCCYCGRWCCRWYLTFVFVPAVATTTTDCCCRFYLITCAGAIRPQTDYGQKAKVWMAWVEGITPVNPHNSLTSGHVRVLGVNQHVDVYNIHFQGCYQRSFPVLSIAHLRHGRRHGTQPRSRTGCWVTDLGNWCSFIWRFQLYYFFKLRCYPQQLLLIADSFIFILFEKGMRELLPSI